MSEPGDRSAMARSAAIQLGPSSLRVGETLAGRFRITAFLGRGAVGEVYEAQDEELSDRVAVKLLRSVIAGDPRALGRFRREVQLARRVTDPRVCRVYDLFRDGERAFLTMERLHGETLGERLRRVGPLSPRQAFPVLAAMAGGLAAAHAAGVVHRDLKASNVFLVPAGNGAEGGDGGGGERVVITDFGLARSADGEVTATLTASGELLGSPAYMAPEQVSGDAVTPATDVYALGVVAYEMVTGQLPFRGPTAVSTALRRLAADAPSPRLLVPELPPAWERALLTCLARRPEERFRDPRHLIRALAPSVQMEARVEVGPAASDSVAPAAALEGSARRRWSAVVAAVLLAAAAGLTLTWWAARGAAPPPAPPPAAAPDGTPSTLSDATPETAADGAAALLERGGQLFTAGDRVESEGVYRQAVDAARAAGDAGAEAAALTGVANSLDASGRVAEATPFYEAALGARRRSGDAAGERRALFNLGRHLLNAGHVPAARRRFEELMVLARAQGADADARHALSILGLTLSLEGDLEQAEQVLRRQLAETTDPDDATALRLSLAQIRARRGAAAEATALLGEALAGYRAAGNRRGEASTLAARGKLERLRGDAAAARRDLAAAAALWRQVGDRAPAARLSVALARLDLQQGDLAAAAGRLQTAVAVLAEIGGNSGLHEALAARGELERLRGDLEAARGDHQRALEIRRSLGSGLGEAESLAGLASVAMDAGPPVEAEVLARAAGERFATSGAIVDEAQARLLLARALRRQGKTTAARRELAAVAALAERREWRPVDLRWRLEAALCDLEGTLPGEHGGAVARLREVERAAAAAGLPEIALEAALGVARNAASGGEGGAAALAAVALRARQAGYGSLEHRARDAAAQQIADRGI